ncbi:murein transglycosylase A [Commensalibacter communis]|uniref:murein transglycosylase A n=1 Tax=Commensalibacter communis TaxID=2972786 RepID=UPI0022FF88C4|nr:murein transglycosylase A [Commensalibacter communis]CAI3947297.1 Membrane-bound lytic murein transglycosylase (MltA) (PDB:2AE0) [Commensalibacter communis]CAI3947506.1 Membrane-bound lytic murein transglycosylase (MltA) (PDB:2AE0) [Commensalibacter communis]
MKSVLRYFTILLAGGLAACVQTQENLSDFYPVSYQNLSGWDKENYGQLLTLFRQNCQYLEKLPPNRHLGGVQGLFGGQTQDWLQSCNAANAVNVADPAQAKQFFETWLQPYQYTINGTTGKVTGYYEPDVEGSTVRTDVYKVPVYRKPRDLIARKNTDGQIEYGFIQGGLFVPYYTRAQIDQGALSGKGLEIAWVKDPIDLFFMQIQGSGRIVLPDGQILRLGYAGKNGQPYTALGRLMIDQGLMDSQSINMFSVRAWLHSHPEQAVSLMEQNKNYVFFRRLTDQRHDTGPIGTLGAPLTAGRSVAVDKQWIPLGVPLWLETTMPSPAQNQTDSLVRYPWKRMVFAQDVGGGVTGMSRVDLFTGWGAQAGWYAGLMNEEGKVFILLPRRSEQQSLPITTTQQPSAQ